jgi:hypothetical protein
VAWQGCSWHSEPVNIGLTVARDVLHLAGVISVSAPTPENVNPQWVLRDFSDAPYGSLEEYICDSLAGRVVSGNYMYTTSCAGGTGHGLNGTKPCLAYCSMRTTVSQSPA